MLAHLRTLERLTVDERVAVLTALERSRLAPLSLAFIGWRTVMTLVFYEDPNSSSRALATPARSGCVTSVACRRSSWWPPGTSACRCTHSLPVAPPAEESGVRLRTDGDAASEHPPAAAPGEESTGSREVA